MLDRFRLRIGVPEVEVGQGEVDLELAVEVTHGLGEQRQVLLLIGAHRWRVLYGLATPLATRALHALGWIFFFARATLLAGPPLIFN